MSQLGATHARLALCDEVVKVLINLNQPLLFCFRSVGASGLNLSKSVSKEAWINGVHHVEQEFALDVLLATVWDVWKVLKHLWVQLDLLDDPLDSQLRAHWNVDV